MDMDQTTPQASQVISPEPKQEVDISKTTITVLVLLTLMISIIGTWTVLNEISNVKTVQKPSTAQGHVSFTITGPPSEPAKSSTTGNVVLEVR